MKFIYPVVLLLLVLFGISIGQGQKKGKKNKTISNKEIELAVGSLTVVKPTQQRTVLVFSHTNGFKHSSIGIGIKALTILGEKTGAYKTVASNDLVHFEPENIAKFDAIVFLNTTGEVFSPLKKKVASLSEEELKTWKDRELKLKESFINFIKSGKGFIGIHSATDTFYEWDEYGEMIGARFDSHPWRHKDQVSIQVPEAALKNPLVSYLDGNNLEFKEEIYQYKNALAEGPKLLLRLDPEKNDFSKSNQAKTKNIPVSWTKPHGDGRVFYSSIGHNENMFSNAQVLQHYLNGIQWAIGDLKTE